MAMGTRQTPQQQLFITPEMLPKIPDAPFYRRLNDILEAANFDREIEALCRPYYEQNDKRGNRSIPPGTYFRMIFVGYYESIESQREIARQCADRRSLGVFLGLGLLDESPDHSTLSKTRKRLPIEVHNAVFQLILKAVESHDLIRGKTVGIDSTYIEADAALRSLVRRDTGESWKEYVIRLMREEGVIGSDETPSDDEIRRFDRRRKDKKVSNEEWVSETDPDANVMRMKDGATDMAYKAEHVVDLETEVILAAEIHTAATADSQTLIDSTLAAQQHLNDAKIDTEIEEVVADKGYHSSDTLEHAEALGYRTYIPRPKNTTNKTGSDRSPDHARAVHNNGERMKRDKGKQLGRLRSEIVERSFAHICDTGGSRRTTLRGLENVRKRYLMSAAAHNLGLIMRKLFGAGKPRAFGLMFLVLYFAYLVQIARSYRKTMLGRVKNGSSDFRVRGYLIKKGTCGL